MKRFKSMAEAEQEYAALEKERDRLLSLLAFELPYTRSRLGVKQSDVARACGVTASYVSRVETGAERPSGAFRKKASEFLRVPQTLAFPAYAEVTT